MSKHTPGPWTIEHPYMETGTYVTCESTAIIAKIYEVDKGNWSGDKRISTKANARLIAAAPDLLEALEDAEFLLRKAAAHPYEAMVMIDSFKRSAEDARNAIHKARGEA